MHSVLLESSCGNTRRTMPPRRKVADPFNQAPNQRGLKKKSSSELPAAASKFQDMTVSQFESEFFMCELRLTESAFQRRRNEVEHYLVRGINQTRVDSLRYVYGG